MNADKVIRACHEYAEACVQEGRPGDRDTHLIDALSRAVIGLCARLEKRAPLPGRAADGLATELATYQRRLIDLMAQVGQWAIIAGDEIGAIKATYELALEAAYRRYGVDRPFLIKQIEAVESARFPGRDWYFSDDWDDPGGVKAPSGALLGEFVDQTCEHDPEEGHMS